MGVFQSGRPWPQHAEHTEDQTILRSMSTCRGHSHASVTVCTKCSALMQPT